MKLVAESLEVADGDGFRNDLMGREPFGEALTNVVLNIENEVVISINARWGEGKTTFVRMWRDVLKTRGIPSIYIDAYRSEYLGEPFLTLASEISALVKNECEGPIAFQEFTAKAKAVGVGLLSWSAKVALKALTLGAVGASEIDQLQEVREDIGAGASDAFGSLVARELGEQSERFAMLDNFRQLLTVLPENIPGNTSKRLVVVVDELDRCSPRYSVEFLERIKHVFSVRNVVFVLVLHKGQLEAAINAVYGPGIDAHSYLQKFINLEAQLPSPMRKTGNGLLRFVQFLNRAHGLQGIPHSEQLMTCAVAHAEYFGLTLRDIERMYTGITVFYAARKGTFVLEPLLVFLCCLKVSKPSAFASLASGKVTHAALLKNLDVDPSTLSTKERPVYVALAWIQYCLMSENEFNELAQDHELRRFQRALWNYAIEASQIIPWHIEALTTFSSGDGS